MKKVFKNKNFVLLILGEIIEQFGNGLNFMALMAWILSIPAEIQNRTFHMSLLMFLMGLPVVILGPFVGVFVDRYKKKSVMLFASVLRGILVFLIFLFISNINNIVFIFLLVFFVSCVAQFYMPAKSSFVPVLMNNKDLFTANSISSTTSIISQIMGLLIGGAFVNIIGIQKALFLNVITYAISSTFFAFINVKEVSLQNKHKPIISVLSELKSGIIFLLNNGKIKFVIRRSFIFMLLVCLFYITFTGSFLNIIIKESNMQMNNVNALTIILMFLGTGMGAGIFFIRRITKLLNTETIIRIIFPVIGLLICLIYFSKNFYILLFVAFLAGVFAVTIFSLAETTIQKNVLENLRGKVFSAYFILRDSSMIIASVVTGISVNFIEAEKIIFFVGIIFLTYGFINFLNKINKKYLASL